MSTAGKEAVVVGCLLREVFPRQVFSLMSAALCPTMEVGVTGRDVDAKLS